MENINRNILVTGSHRSGTTWVGEILSVNSEVAYVFEPFNWRLQPNYTGNVFRRNYQYIDDFNENEYKTHISRIFDLKYPLLGNLLKLNSFRALKRCSVSACRNIRYKRTAKRVLMKDPLALFSSPWLAKEFDVQVIVMIRHPAAFAASLLDKDWQFEFEYFLDQKELMGEYFSQFETTIRYYSQEKQSLLNQSVLLWNCIHSVIDVYQKKFPEWIFIKHEELSTDPMEGFRKLYEKLGLEFSAEVKKQIALKSGASGRIEETDRRRTVRDSKNIVGKWKHKLSSEEIDYIRKGTQIVSTKFYKDSDW